MYALKKEKQETGHEQQPRRKSWSNHDIFSQSLGLQTANSHGIPNKNLTVSAYADFPPQVIWKPILKEQLGQEWGSLNKTHL